MELTIHKLRLAGFKVRVMHTRVLNTKANCNATQTEVSGYGGNTKIELTSPDKQATVAGIAECSKQDRFNRKLGNSIALGRAVAKIQQVQPELKNILNNL